MHLSSSVGAGPGNAPGMLLIFGSGAETQVVVPVPRVVPVAVGGTAVSAVVVPAATTIHAVRARYFPAP